MRNWEPLMERTGNSAPRETVNGNLIKGQRPRLNRRDTKKRCKRNEARGQIWQAGLGRLESRRGTRSNRPEKKCDPSVLTCSFSDCPVHSGPKNQPNLPPALTPPRKTSPIYCSDHVTQSSVQGKQKKISKGVGALVKILMLLSG